MQRSRRPPFEEDPDIPAEWNGLTERVIGCAMEVHTVLGPGLLERLYEEAMCYELDRAGIPYQRQFAFRVPYKDTVLSEQRMDLLVAGRLIVELKAREGVTDGHLAQLVSYMRSARLPLGLLINFNVTHLRDGIWRRVNSRQARRSQVSSSSATSAFKP